MQDGARSVEAELQQIEDEFASGRMNAFGSMATQDAFVSELRQIADIETQVFYRMCRILKNSKEDEHAILTGMFASASEPPPASTSGRGTAGGHPPTMVCSLQPWRMRRQPHWRRGSITL